MFQIAPFKSGYHALLGRPTFTKFMAILNYTYLELKMQGPNRVITMSRDYKRSHQAK